MKSNYVLLLSLIQQLRYSETSLIWTNNNAAQNFFMIKCILNNYKML